MNESKIGVVKKAKEEAKREMFITPYVNKKSVDVLDELRDIKKKRSQIQK